MSELLDAIKDVLWGELENKFHTCLPAIVNSYDPTGPKVEVQPLLRKAYNNGKEISFKPIIEVPVIFPRTKRCRFTFPLERGDTVLLLFSERSIETWLAGDGSEVTPLDGKKFSLTDAIAIPGLFAFGQGSPIEDGNKLEIVFDNAKFISDGEGFEITGNLKVNGKVEATDNIESDAEVKAGSVKLSTHTHSLNIPSTPYNLPTGGPS